MIDFSPNEYVSPGVQPGRYLGKTGRTLTRAAFWGVCKRLLNPGQCRRIGALLFLIECRWSQGEGLPFNLERLSYITAGCHRIRILSDTWMHYQHVTLNFIGS